MPLLGRIMEEIVLRPVGVIRSSFTDPEGTPIQTSGGRGITGTVEIFSEFVGGLKDLKEFSHIVLIYYFHRSEGYSLELTPFLDDTPRGVFSTRAPRRPNPIGLSIVRLVGVEGSILRIEDLDVLDGTPVLDIKPYVPDLNPEGEIRIGWLQGKIDRARTVRADQRFSQC